MYALAERPCATTVPIKLARQIKTSKLIEKRIELNSSSVLTQVELERGPPEPALGETSFAIDPGGALGVVTVSI